MLNILKAMQLYILGSWYMNCTSIKLLSKLYEVVIAVYEPAEEVSTRQVQVFLPLNTKLKMELGIGEDLKQSKQSKSAPMEQEGEN